MKIQNRINSYLYLYRFIVLIYMLFWWFESIIRFYHLNKIWPIMFTHWTTTMQIVDLLHKFFRYRVENFETVRQNGQSILSKLTFSSSLLVTILFWLLVLPSKYRNDPNYIVTIGEVHAHGVNLFVCFLEIVYFFLINFQKLNNKRFYLNFKLINYKKAFLGLQIYILCYFLFAFLYWLFDKEKNVIYDSMNFNKPKSAVIISTFIFFIVSPLFIFLTFFVEFLFKNVFMKIFIKKKKV
jgi:hypothetical protein